MSKVISAESAIGFIKDGDTIAVDGLTYGCPEELCLAVEESFLKTGKPAGLILFGPGGAGNTRGLGFDHFANEGLIAKYVGSYLNLTRKLDKLVREEKTEGYLMPLGAGCHLLREISAGRPGLFRSNGLKTYIDPRYEGGRLNSISNDARYIPKIMDVEGKEYLFFKTFNIDVAFVRGTTADENGNVTFEKEAGYAAGLEMAMATRKCGGKVIVQVERVAARGTLNPKDVRIPGVLIDAIVVAQPKNHKMTWNIHYDPSISGEIHLPKGKAPDVPFDFRKAVARRGVMELAPGMIVNLGAGMSEFIGSIAWEEGIEDQITFSIEAGMIGGVPGFGLNFNTAVNAECILSQPTMLDFLDGGLHSITMLGFAQIDQYGNVNVSKVNQRIPGIGGFHDVALSPKKRFHVGAFTAGKSDIRIENGRLNIVEDGEFLKFVDKVDQISASGEYALEVGQYTGVITDRCVFEWTPEGWVIVEIAPGVSLEENILAKMSFKPMISRNLKEMSADLFMEPLLGLKNRYPWKR